jgi:tetratricopeptide (TPR) repeat protein
MMKVAAIFTVLFIFVSCNLTPQKKIDEETDAIKSDSNNATLYYLRGVTLMNFAEESVPTFVGSLLKKKDIDAWHDFTKAIKINPSYAEAYEKRALVEYRIDDTLGNALDDFDNAIKLKPNFAEAYFDRGVYLNNIDNDLRSKKGCPDICKAYELGYPRDSLYQCDCNKNK